MKINEVLGESYIVYKVTSPHTKSVYYGYSVNKDPKSAFLDAAARADMPDRGEVRFVRDEAKNDIDSLKFHEIEEFNDEIEAFLERNKLRSEDPRSITGPTQFPGHVHHRAMQQHPQRVQQITDRHKLNNATAREAMSDQFKHISGLTFSMVKEFVNKNPSKAEEIKRDLDKLKYPEFMEKYFPQKQR